jgi:hypothetical protein
MNIVKPGYLNLPEIVALFSVHPSCYRQLEQMLKIKPAFIQKWENRDYSTRYYLPEDVYSGVVEKMMTGWLPWMRGTNRRDWQFTFEQAEERLRAPKTIAAMLDKKRREREAVMKPPVQKVAAKLAPCAPVQKFLQETKERTAKSLAEAPKLSPKGSLMQRMQSAEDSLQKVALATNGALDTIQKRLLALEKPKEAAQGTPDLEALFDLLKHVNARVAMLERETGYVTPEAPAEKSTGFAAEGATGR